MIPKEIPERDEDYKAWVRTLPCAKCGAKGYSVAHHQPKRGDSTMGGKCSDRRCLPLCRPHYFRGGLIEGCHQEFHRRSWPFWGDRDVESLIERMNEVYARCIRPKKTG